MKMKALAFLVVAICGVSIAAKSTELVQAAFDFFAPTHNGTDSL